MTASLVRLLADTDIDPTTGRGPEWGKAAPVALLIIVLMGIALFLLIKSMNRQLRKVPSEFQTSSDIPEGGTRGASRAGLSTIDPGGEPGPGGKTGPTGPAAIGDAANGDAPSGRESDH